MNEYNYLRIPYIYKQNILKDTNKIYFPHRIYGDKIWVCALTANGANKELLPIKRVRAKSIVLSNKVCKGERLFCIYERIALARQVILEAKDFQKPLDKPEIV